MQNSDKGRSFDFSLANSPESLKSCQTPAESPFSKSMLNLLSPLRLLSSPRAYPQTQLISPSNACESLNLLSPILQDKTCPQKFIQKLDFSNISSTTHMKFNCLSAKITMAQDKDKDRDRDNTTPTFKPVKRPRKDSSSGSKICCNCQKSKCLKLYCDCFAAGIYCEGCNCRECMNTQTCENMRRDAVAATLDRNPSAFKPKIKTVNLKGEALAVHGRGCNCSKSGCLKKYCECFQSKIKCTESCRCIGCKNVEKNSSQSVFPL